MLYLETMFRTCTRISREKKTFVRSIIVLDLAGFSFSTLVNIGLVTKLVAVSLQWKNPDFLLKNPGFLLKNPDLPIWNLDFLLKNC